jgi:hypothetical protein
MAACLLVTIIIGIIMIVIINLSVQRAGVFAKS